MAVKDALTEKTEVLAALRAQTLNWNSALSQNVC